MVDIRTVDGLEELRAAFDLAGAQLREPVSSSDFRFQDLEAHSGRSTDHAAGDDRWSRRGSSTGVPDR